MDERAGDASAQWLRNECGRVGATCASGNLRRASRAMTQLYARALAPSGLEPTQFMVLSSCAVHGPVALSELAERLVMDRTTLSRNLQPLAKQGLVAVAAGEDRRQRVVALTGAGRAAMARALPLWEEAQARVTAAFGQERLKALLGELSAVVRVARDA